MSPKFNERLSREIKLFMQEMRDGCVDCRIAKGTCHEHKKIAIDLIFNPRKYLDLKPKR